MTNTLPIKRALLSVSDKTQLIELAKILHEKDVEIISTGGTSQALKEANIPHRQVDELTGLKAMLDGRVKTLHPTLHGGILGKRDEHAAEAKEHGIEWIDLVVVNFYPFTAKVTSLDMDWDDVVEYIDIGGPTMVRAAAKNFAWVGVLVNPNDYAAVIQMMKQKGGLTEAMRVSLAAKAFSYVYEYDAAIHQYFNKRVVTENKTMDLHLVEALALRYGENPHQKATAYQFKNKKGGVLSAKQCQGKPLSYNNLLDADAAVNCMREFTEPACVIVKHANPCGVASAQDINLAYERAYAADSLSAFGGIIALNRACTKEIAKAVAGIFMEVLIAPAFTEEALEILAKKPNLRVLEMPIDKTCPWELRFITGGVLKQEKDQQQINEQALQIVTQQKPTQTELQSMCFAWHVLKHIKSNGILLAKDNATVGIGAGQVSRIDAVDLAIRKAGEHIEGCVLASDAFFPFRDSIDRIAKTGVKAIIQPGGSVKDAEVIAACDEYGISMVFTGQRCFKH